MPDIPFTTDGFVDMDTFDGVDPDAFDSLGELGGTDVVPSLGDDHWGEMLNDVFDGDVDTDIDVDDLVDGGDLFDHDETAGDDQPFDVDDLWGGDGSADDAALNDISLDDGDRTDTLEPVDEDVDDLDDELGLDEPSDDEAYDDTGSNVGSLVDFEDDGGDLGANVGDLVDFEDDQVGIDDDLDALENTDFDHA